MSRGRAPSTAETGLGYRYHSQTPELRGRILGFEEPLGDVLLARAGDEQYPGFGRKRADLVSYIQPTLAELKDELNAQTLYNGIGQTVVKQSILAAERDIDVSAIDARVVFGSAGFEVRDPPLMAQVVAAELSRHGVRLVIRAEDGTFADLTEDYHE